MSIDTKRKTKRKFEAFKRVIDKTKFWVFQCGEGYAIFTRGSAGRYGRKHVRVSRVFETEAAAKRELSRKKAALAGGVSFAYNGPTKPDC